MLLGESVLGTYLPDETFYGAWIIDPLTGKSMEYSSACIFCLDAILKIQRLKNIIRIISPS